MPKINFKNLRRIREEAGLKQSDMAELLGYSGATGYSMLENSNQDITLTKAKLISEIFDKPIEEIFFKD